MNTRSVARVIAVGDKIHSISQSVNRLLTLSPRYVMVTFFTHRTALEGGEGGELAAIGGGSVDQNS